MRLTQLIVFLTICSAISCLGQQEKDLVFGDVTKNEIIESIEFADSTCNKCDVVRIDNVHAGWAWLIIISENRILKINDFRNPDVFEMDKRTISLILDYIKKNNTGLLERPKDFGTYRIVYRINNAIDMYFVGRDKSVQYFENFQKVIPITSEVNEKLHWSFGQIAQQIQTR